MNRISFPQGTLYIDDGGKVRQVVFASAGGRKPAAGWIKLVEKNLPGDYLVAAADKGLDYLLSADIIPSFVVGDGDTANEKNWEAAKRSSRIEVFEYPCDKDLTDLQLLLPRLPEDALWIITGIFGGRMDHLLSALHTVHAWARKLGGPIILADERELAVIVPEGIKLNFRPPQGESPVAISVLSLSETAKVSIRGVKWPLEKAEIKREDPYAVSNEMSEEELLSEFPEVRFACHEGEAAFCIVG